MKLLVALLATLLAAPALAEVPFNFHGSAGAEAQANRVYDRNGDSIGDNYKCVSSPPVTTSAAGRAVCYCDSDTDDLQCSINGEDYDSLVLGADIETLDYDFLAIPIADNGTGSTATATLPDPVKQHTIYSVSCVDAQGCTVSLPASGINGWDFTVVVTSVFGNPVIIAPNAIQNIMADGGWRADNGDTIGFVWRPSAWFETSRSSNHTDADGQEVSVADSGDGSKATFSFDPLHSLITISCLDMDGCEPSAVTTTYGYPGRIIYIIVANSTVTFNDITNLQVTGSAINVTPLQNVSFLYRGGEWIQHTPVLP